MAKKKIKVTIVVEDVMFDILNTTHRAGLAFESANDAGYETAAQMIASLDDEDVMQIRRSISAAASRIKTEFGEYLNENAEEVNNRIANEVMKDDGEIVYNFLLPGNFNSSAVQAMVASMHEYIVSSAVNDWFTITNPTAVKTYQDCMTTALDNAKRALYKRSRPVRPTYYDNPTGGN